jgi:peptidoglycan/LPS O-acetylase OafA/YrhL
VTAQVVEHATVTRAASPALSDVSFQHFKLAEYFGSLNGLRFLSILAVACHHSLGNKLASLGIRHLGGTGVQLFFAISGFLIVTLMLRSRDAAGAFSLRRFYARRVLRIFPLYFAVLALYVVVVCFFERNPLGRAEFFRNLPSFATFTSNWFVNSDNPRIIFVFAWSLAAEEQFYLYWPLVERFSFAARRAVVAVLCLIFLSQLVLFIYPDQLSSTLGLRIVASFPAAIGLGVLLAHILDTQAGYRMVHAVLGRSWSAAAALAAVAAAVAQQDRLGGLAPFMTDVAMAGLVASCVVREDNALAPLLRFPPIDKIGQISYGIYLLHMLCINAVRRLALGAGISSPYCDLVFGFALAAAVAWLSFTYYEAWFLRLKDRVFSERAERRRRAAGVPVTVENFGFSDVTSSEPAPARLSR